MVPTFHIGGGGKALLYVYEGCKYLKIRDGKDHMFWKMQKAQKPMSSKSDYS